MKHISVIVYEDVVLSNLAGVYSLFVTANQVQRQKGLPQPFAVELVGVRRKEVPLNLPVHFHCTQTIFDEFSTDLIILPGISDLARPVDQVVRDHGPLIRWLQDKKAEGVEILSLCTGAYFLAEGSLLDGREATTHWQAADTLQSLYPKVKFRSERVTVDHQGIITGGGAYASFHTALYMIEKYAGKRLAVEISRIHGIEYGKTDQGLFSIFQGQRRHEDPKIHEAQSLMEQAFAGELSIEAVAAHVHMSRRNFIRRFRAATGLNPIEYLQRLRIEAAKKALEEGQVGLSSLAYHVGYNDLKTFRATFKKTTGYSPQQYQKIYSYRDDL